MAIEIMGVRPPEQRRPLPGDGNQDTGHGSPDSGRSVWRRVGRRSATGSTSEQSTDEATGRGTWTASWNAWGTTAYVTVTDPGLLPAARRIVAQQVAAAEKAAARTRPDAEIHRLYRAGGRPITVSPLLAELISAALIAAERSGGDVDPTVAAAVTRANAARRDLTSVPACGGPATPARPAVGYEAVGLQGRRLHVPPGVTLDLSATAKAVTCDTAAAQVHGRLGVGVLVGLGANVASAGPGPDEGWIVTLTEPGVAEHTRVSIPAGAALASRFTRVADGLIDPRTGRAPHPVWRSATAIGFTAVEAATYTAAALVRGTSARGWLSQLWVPARLITVHGDAIEVGPWLAHEITLRDGETAATAPVVPHQSTESPEPSVANPRRTTLR